MRNPVLTLACLGVLLVVLPPRLLAQQVPLEVAATPIPRCIVGLPCVAGVQAHGGSEPYIWRMVRGSLPPGLQLDAASGRISGNATAAGDHEVLIEVADSSKPPQAASRLFTIKVLRALALDWKTPPTLQATTISGSVTVTNNSDDTMDLTVIIVAVNEIGKAFALGYQHLDFAPETTLATIPFSSQLPGGRYTVRADAIAEIPAKNKIFRSAREAGAIQVPVQ